MTIIYDTGSTWTWVQEKGCSGSPSGACTKVSETYDPSLSDFNQPVLSYTGTQEIIYLSYGIGSAKGKLYTDRVCLDSGANICVDNLKMLGLT